MEIEAPIVEFSKKNVVIKTTKNDAGGYLSLKYSDADLTENFIFEGKFQSSNDMSNVTVDLKSPYSCMKELHVSVTSKQGGIELKSKLNEQFINADIYVEASTAVTQATLTVKTSNPNFKDFSFDGSFDHTINKLEGQVKLNEKIQKMNGIIQMKDGLVNGMFSMEGSFVNIKFDGEYNPKAGTISLKGKNTSGENIHINLIGSFNELKGSLSSTVKVDQLDIDENIAIDYEPQVNGGIIRYKRNTEEFQYMADWTDEDGKTTIVVKTPIRGFELITGEIQRFFKAASSTFLFKTVITLDGDEVIGVKFSREGPTSFNVEIKSPFELLKIVNLRASFPVTSFPKRQDTAQFMGALRVVSLFVQKLLTAGY